MPELEPQLLHVIGDAPEGPWSVFSLPTGDHTAMVSVIIPRSLWLEISRRDPFSSDLSLIERIGRMAILHRLQQTGELETIVVDTDDIQELWNKPDEPWYMTLRRCGQCHEMVPHGEVLEALANALPPNSRGQITVEVLCPACMVQTSHVLNPWGVVGR
ncbi:hypothetical protein [Sulfobacillus thermosulfidooxidans]|uniref:hypothetical protein n=1 Tax=Sulfobacillus thermosulfidooxidans TaxID=28034 RepID=UPI0002D582A8|nr:hypothetical protein [Sulfobacillus thermosulfidooxidans]